MFGAFADMPANQTFAAEDAELRAVIRKVSVRLLPFLFTLYVVAYLDRVNVGFAALQMKSALRFSDSVYGFGAGIFFVGYLLFQVPSNLAQVKIGARRWLGVIIFCWGVISSCTMFVHSPVSFYVLRFSLGATEAGFFPGVLLYLTYWFPATTRARSIAWFMIAMPVSGIIGGPLSGALLSMRGVSNLAGWQWLFLIEGLPAIILGAFVPFILTEKPSDADWLSDTEREVLLAAIDRDSSGPSRSHTTSAGADLSVQVCEPQSRGSILLGVIARRETWLLCAAYFTLLWSSLGLSLWLPEIVKTFSGFSDRMVGVLSAAPYVVAAVAMGFVAARSDKTRQPHLHFAVCVFAGAAGFFLSAQPHHVLLSTIFLSVSVAGVYSAFGPFWAMPGEFLSGASAAAGIAFINSLGNLGGLFGPYVTGMVKQRTGSFAAGTIILGGVLLLSGIFALAVKATQSDRQSH
jgi:ACS family tartrate transporter-like MFS transporter